MSPLKGMRDHWPWRELLFLCCLLTAHFACQAAPPRPSDEGRMIWIPAGKFLMGSDDRESNPEERPARQVQVAGFWMDETDVTNAQFARFVVATGYVTTAEKEPTWDALKNELPPGTEKPAALHLAPGSLVFSPPAPPVDLHDLSQWWRWVPGASWKHPRGPGSNLDGAGNQPVTQVSFPDAAAYAKWAGKRLPTEAEWERAARGGLPKARFAWGATFRPNGRWMANIWTGKFPDHDTGEDGFKGPSPVASFPPNGYGLYDMAGNVWNWCASAFEASTAARCESCGPLPLARGQQLTIKGGSYLCSPEYCASYRPSARQGAFPETGTNHLGFRCAKSGSPRSSK